MVGKINPVSKIINIGDKKRKRPTKSDFKNYVKPPNDTA